MSLQGTIEESYENDDDSESDNLDSLTWQEIAEHSMNIIIIESVIKEFITLVDPENEEDKLPDQLLEVANTVLRISLGIKVNYLLTYSYYHSQINFHFSR